MPMLAAEPNVYPPNLFDTQSCEERVGRAWWVVHTRPRQEKSLSRQLLSAHVPFYLPLVERRTSVRGRLLSSYNPLFTGYLFVLADSSERIFTLSTKRTVRILEVSDQAALWRDLGQVNRLIASGMPIDPEDRLYPGALVEVRSGPLTGLRGRIVRGMSGRKFIVQVDFIQKGASVLLDDYALASVAEPDRVA